LVTTDYTRARRHLARRDPVLRDLMRAHGKCGLAEAQNADAASARVDNEISPSVEDSRRGGFRLVGCAEGVALQRPDRLCCSGRGVVGVHGVASLDHDAVFGQRDRAAGDERPVVRIEARPWEHAAVGETLLDGSEHKRILLSHEKTVALSVDQEPVPPPLPGGSSAPGQSPDGGVLQVLASA